VEKLNAQMTLSLLAFGKLSDFFGSDPVEIPYFETVRELRKHLTQIHSEIALYSYAVAVNRVVADDDHEIQPGSEVVLLPPFSGG
jgi:molybdopterin converting factor small subunit